jgi:NADPH2:quinone reductase
MKTFPAINQGDDIAGFIHTIGPNVTEFKVGDRVAAFHEMLQPGGSYAEYGVAWQHTTFHLPAKTSFEEGASIPLAAMTAALGLFQRLGLPEPWQKNTLVGKAFKGEPLLIWGVGSAVGSYALQLAKRAGIGPIVTVAGRSVAHAKQFLDFGAGDVVLDYRDGEDKVIEGIKKALGGKKLKYAFDAISEKGSTASVCKVLDPIEGRIALVLPGKEYPMIPKTVHQDITQVGNVHGMGQGDEDRDFGYVWFRYFSKGLREGWFKGHPVEVVPGGLAGIEQGLRNLKAGKASAVKYVFRIADTPGIRSNM